MMDETFDSDECICPKCGYSYQVESEDYSEDKRIEECGKCGYKYRTWQEFTVTTHASPDCALNDLPHTWVYGAAGAREYWRCPTCSRVTITDPEAKP
jgi:hypothetical protein